LINKLERSPSRNLYLMDIEDIKIELYGYNTWNFPFYVSMDREGLRVCVCVCVCVREREGRGDIYGNEMAIEILLFTCKLFIDIKQKSMVGVRQRKNLLTIV
jgi:hypothetical protein